MARRKRWFQSAYAAGLTLALLAAWTRLPLLSAQAGEADSARFLIGLRAWQRFGPHAAGIYGELFSPLYYWTAAHLAAWQRTAPTQAGLMLAWLSALAAIATAPLLLALGRQLVSSLAAFVATVLFILSPAFWWLGLEAHPQSLSVFFLVASLYAFARACRARSRRSRLAALLLSVFALTLALGFKSDAVLLLPAYIYFAARRSDARQRASQPPRIDHAAIERPAERETKSCEIPQGGSLPASAWSHRLASLWPAALTWAGAGVLALAARQAILGASLRQTHFQAAGTVAAFLGWPHGGADFARQVAPMIFAPGWAVWPWIFAGSVFLTLALTAPAMGSPVRLQPWPWYVFFVVAWSLPSYIFWFFIRGNNVRHVVLAAVPLFWLAAEGWLVYLRAMPRSRPAAVRRDGGRPRRALLAGLVLAGVMAGDFLLPPPNSNLTLYPAGNVPASAALLHQREAEMRTLALALAAGADPAGRAPESPAQAFYLSAHQPIGWANAGLAPLAGRRSAPASACYFGAYTDPYLIHALLLAFPQAQWRFPSDRAALPPALLFSEVALPGGAVVRFVEIENAAWSAAVRHLPGCARAISLEFDAAGRHRRFLGREWRWFIR